MPADVTASISRSRSPTSFFSLAFARERTDLTTVANLHWCSGREPVEHVEKNDGSTSAPVEIKDSYRSISRAPGRHFRRVKAKGPPFGRLGCAVFVGVPDRAE